MPQQNETASGAVDQVLALSKIFFSRHVINIQQYQLINAPG